MLENIHDVAPGASLAFATADPNELTFANNINALATTAHANIIADDVSYFDEPFFQDGIVAQAVDNVTVAGRDLLRRRRATRPTTATSRPSAPANATVAGIGTGTFMNFNPNGGTNVELPITTDGNNAIVTFEYDQPYETQEPAGSTATVTSERLHLPARFQRQCHRRGGRAEQQRRDPGADPAVRHPQRGQLRRRDPGGLGGEPGTRRVHQR